MVTVTMVAVYRLYDATGKFFLCENAEIVIVSGCELCIPCLLNQLSDEAEKPRPFSELKSVSFFLS